MRWMQVMIPAKGGSGARILNLKLTQMLYMDPEAIFIKPVVSFLAY